LDPGNDVKDTEIDIVKEQILDLNDKFDFLIQLMIKNQKLAVVKDEDDNNESLYKMMVIQFKMLRLQRIRRSLKNW